MPLFKKMFFAFFLSCSAIVGAQEKPTNMNDLSEVYADYFKLNREVIFLHLNKTVVVPGENIWFAAYVFNPKIQRLNYLTTNLHVNVYNAEGLLMEAETVYMQNGHGAGYFKLDSLYTPGKYQIRASTKYMDNFRENLAFTHTFTILGESNELPIPVEYDLQLLPEGGHLVSNVLNTVGVKLINNSGKGVFFTNGKLLNEQNEVVNTFKSNQFGLSKFGFIPVSGKKYHVVLTPSNGNQIHEVLPVASSKGIVLGANTMQPDKIIFSFRTNPKTYESIIGKTFYMAMHQKGKMKVIGFIIPHDKMEAIIPISKKALWPGINTITVFNENFDPILERMVFNRLGIKRKLISGNFLRKERDSLVLNFKSADTLGLHTLSISILPKETKAYQPQNNIFSAFYIEPYIRGELENGAYYFYNNIEERRRDYDMDLLLLTQGWTKYLWHNVFHNTPTELFEHEQGFSLRGTINNRNEEKENHVFLKSANNGLFKMIELKEDGSFKLENIFLSDSSEISIGLVNKNHKISKPSIYMQVFPVKKSKAIETVLKPNELVFSEKKQVFRENLIVPKNFIQNTVSLDSILLIAKQKEKETSIFYTSFGTKVVKVTDDLSKSFIFVTNLIRFNGFGVVSDFNSVKIYSQRGTHFSGPLKTLIVLNGMPLTDNFELLNLKTRDVETITFNKSGGNYGSRAPGGIIHIETKNGHGSAANSSQSIFSYIAENGFAQQKEFYAPKYTTYTSKLFDEYGVIGWFPTVILDENGSASVKILNTMQPMLKVYVEGMTSGGALISEIMNLKID